MSSPRDGDVQLAGQVALEPDPAAELHAAAAHRRRHIVEPDAARIEADRAVDGIERIRQREVADAAVGDRRAAGEHRLVERTVDRRRRARRGPSRARRGRTPAGCRGWRRRRPAARSARSCSAIVPPIAEPRVVADQLAAPRRGRRADRARAGSGRRSGSRSRTAASRGVDRAVDEQAIDVGELARDADRSARDGRRVRRQPRHEQPHVGIERAVVEPERQLGIGCRRRARCARCRSRPAAATRRRARR